MNEARPFSVQPRTADVRQFVRLGVSTFADAYAGDDQEQIVLGEWPALARRMAENMMELDDALGALADDFALDVAELFTVALCGEVEADHDLALRVARLQGEGAPGHPQLHLIEALSWCLFGRRLSPLAMLAHRLTAAGVLTVGKASGPAPFSTLSMPPQLWSILKGGSASWDGVRPLEAGDAELLPRDAMAVLPRLAGQLETGALSGLVLRGGPDIALTAATEIADQIGLLPVLCENEVWNTDKALHAACRYGRWLPVVRLRLGPGERHRPAFSPIKQPAVYVLGRDGGVAGKRLAELRIEPPGRETRSALWQQWSGPCEVAGELGRYAALDGPTIQTICQSAQLTAERAGETTRLSHLVAARRAIVAESLLRLAQPVSREVTRNAIVLPPAISGRFDDLIVRCKEREAAWDGLGPALAGDRNPGVHALFVGPSGTGKTLAVSHLATCLGAPLYRLDLSTVLNKYIGETEKNLSAALDQACDLDVILMMDEADALFGRRTDGDGEGERFGNMLTNFLLTRIETHPGIVVLTSNSRARFDPAFTRRLHAVIEFPEPGFEERLAIWQSHLGERSPGPDAVRLLASQCDLAGGFVRTAVLAAAAQVPLPEGGGRIPAAKLARAAVSEYEKLGRTVPAGLADMAG